MRMTNVQRLGAAVRWLLRLLEVRVPMSAASGVRTRN